MSWALFNHNVGIAVSQDDLLPSEGSTTVSECSNIFSGSGNSSGLDTINQGYHRFAVDEVGGKIMLISTSTSLLFSDDHGDTWVSKTLPTPPSFTAILVSVFWSVQLDCWFVIARNVNTSSGWFFWSQDDGSTWTILTASTGTHRAYGAALNSSGLPVLPMNTNRVTIWNDPINNPSDQSSVEFTGYNNGNYRIPVQGSEYGFIMHGDGGGDWFYVNDTVTSYALVGVTLTPQPQNTRFGSGCDTPLGKLLIPVRPTEGDTSVAIREYTPGVGLSDFTISLGSGVYISTADVVLVRDVAAGYVHCFVRAIETAGPYNDGVLLAMSSRTGADGSWSGPRRIQLASTQIMTAIANNGSAMHIKVVSAGRFYIMYYAETTPSVDTLRWKLSCFDFGGAQPVLVQPEGGMSSEINKQSPDIFYKMDDTGSPESVLDLGRKNYPNVTSGAITFEEDGLVSDSGTAALFGAGKIRATVTSSSPTWSVDKSRPPIVNGMANDGGQIYEGSAVGSLIATAIGGVRYVSSEVYGQILGLAPTGGADNHVHLFILSHDDTAATRLLVSYGDAFKLELTTDHKLKFTAGAETLTSTSAITADTATLALLSIEKYGGKVNLYIEDGHEGVDTFTLSAPSVESVVLGGQWDGSAYTGDASGVTIDYYAMIPFANADIGALQDAWGVTATPPAAPSVGVGSARLLVKADTAPVIRNYFSTELNQWMQVYGIPNNATGAQDVHSWIDGGAGVVDLADGKFGGGSLSIPDRSYLQSYLPHMEPAWVGFHDLALGTRDFTFAAWVKPMNSDGEAYVLSSQPYYRRNGVWYRFAGFTLSIGYDATGTTGGLRLTVGHTLDDALGGPSLKDAFQRQWVGFSGFAYNQWNYVTLCRKNKQWYAMIGGRRHTSLTRNSGNQDAPVIMEPRFRSMFFGKALIAHDGNTKLGSDAKAVKIDDAVFILDEALYTQEFTPPTSAFVI